MADAFLVPYIRARWELLKTQLPLGKKFALYGAGAHTRWLLNVTRDLSDLRPTVILDDEPKTRAIDGIPVCHPSDVAADDLGLVLISSDQWESLMVGRCRDWFGGRVMIERLYEHLPPGPYDKRDDRTTALRLLADRSAGDALDDGLIIMISDQPRAREAKLAVALQAAGLRAVLLHRDTPSFDPNKYFTESRRFGHPWEALRMACGYRPLAYHVIANSDYRTARIFAENRPGPLVIDPYDIIAGMSTPEFFQARPALAAGKDDERFVLESAEAICTRSRECDHLADAFGYRLAPRFYVPDGCWNDAACSPGDKNDELHLVYVGNMNVEKRAGDAFAARGYKLWLARLLAESGIHYHLYPSCPLGDESFDEAFSDYRELERRTPYFHLHRPVPPDEMINALSGYDLGVFIYNETSGLRDAPCPLTEAKIRLSTANKFFDYFDAGLGVFHNSPPGSLLAELADEFDAGINVAGVPIDDWPSVLRSVDRRRIRESAVAARAACDIRRKSDALRQMYEGAHRRYQESVRSAVAIRVDRTAGKSAKSDHQELQRVQE